MQSKELHEVYHKRGEATGAAGALTLTLSRGEGMYAITSCSSHARGAFHRFLPAAVAVVTLGGFDARAEFTFDNRFSCSSSRFCQKPTARPARYAAPSAVTSRTSGVPRGAQNVGLELHQEVVRDRTAVHAQRVQTDAGVSLHRFQYVARLVR